MQLLQRSTLLSIVNEYAYAFDFRVLHRFFPKQVYLYGPGVLSYKKKVSGRAVVCATAEVRCTSCLCVCVCGSSCFFVVYLSKSIICTKKRANEYIIIYIYNILILVRALHPKLSRKLGMDRWKGRPSLNLPSFSGSILALK